MLKILSVRHGEAKRNPKQGDYKWDLTPKGEQQAIATAKFIDAYYKKNKPSGKSGKVRLYGSPLYRAAFTAFHILSETQNVPWEVRADGSPFFVDANLAELRFGLLSARSKDEMKAEFDNHKKDITLMKEKIDAVMKKARTTEIKEMLETISDYIDKTQGNHVMEKLLENFEVLRQDKDGGNFFADRIGGNSPADVYLHAGAVMSRIYNANTDDGVDDFVVVSHGGTDKVLNLCATGSNPLLYDKITGLEYGAVSLIKTEWNGTKLQSYGHIFDPSSDLKRLVDPRKPQVFGLSDSYPKVAERFPNLQNKFPDLKI